MICAGSALASSITVEVIPALAPNADGSPSWEGWEANALLALETSASAVGTPGTPTYYQSLSGPVDASETIVTGFNSWLGVADPGAPYDQESGNRMTFGLAINGNGTQFSISELGFEADSNDAGDVLQFSYGVGSYDYGANYVGVVYGTNGGPNTYITSGPDTQLVDAIFSRGSGNSMPAYCAGCDTADEQAAIQAAVAAMAGVTQFTGTYYLSTDSNEADAFTSGSGAFDITGTTPEPSTLWLLLGAIPVAVLVRRRALASNQ
jgi:hypothetical protein